MLNHTARVLPSYLDYCALLRQDTVDLWIYHSGRSLQRCGHKQSLVSCCCTLSLIPPTSFSSNQTSETDG